MNVHDQIEAEPLPRDAQLSAALRMLAAATPEMDYAEIEERLRLAFADQQRVRNRARRMRWGQVAAAFLLACSGAGWWWFGRTPVRPTPPLEARALATTIDTAVSFAQPVPHAIVNARPTAPGSAESVRPAADEWLENAVGVLADFIPLPGAAALPDFERGGIVRIEVPIAGLAAYGLDMVPDAAPTSVPADLLIGQDGVPRAIRLTSERVR